MQAHVTEKRSELSFKLFLIEEYGPDNISQT